MIFCIFGLVNVPNRMLLHVFGCNLNRLSLDDPNTGKLNLNFCCFKFDLNFGCYY